MINKPVSIFLFFVLLLPITVMAGENLFDITSTTQAQIDAPLSAADRAQSIGKKHIILNDKLLFSVAGDELDFMTVAGTPYTVIFDRIVKGRKANTWIGHLKNHGIQYRVLITLNKKVIEGRITTPEGVMRIKSANNALILIDYELEGMQKVPFGNDVVLPEEDAPLSAPDEALSSGQENVTQEAAPSSYNGNTIVDVLVLYNADFKTRNNNDPSARIDHLAALANQAYLDSQISMQIRVVGTELIDYSTTPSNDDALDAISDTNDSTPDLAIAVAALREQVGADLVMFIRPFKASTHGGCGLAYLNRYMSSSAIFGTVGDGIDIDYSGSGGWSYCAEDALAHELGHTMGTTHDLANAGSQGHYPYSYGFGTNDTFGTIMSYTSPDVSLFSNPDLSTECNGYTCGSANADNARSLNNDKDTISAFRDEVIISSDVNLNGIYLLLL